MTRPTGPPGAQDHPDKDDHQRRQPRQRQQPPAPIRSSAAVHRSVTHLRVLADEGEISLTAHDQLLETPDASDAGTLGRLLEHGRSRRLLPPGHRHRREPTAPSATGPLRLPDSGGIRTCRYRSQMTWAWAISSAGAAIPASASSRQIEPERRGVAPRATAPGSIQLQTDCGLSLCVRHADQSAVVRRRRSLSPRPHRARGLSSSV
jgi:hypothetical protein